MLDVPSTPERGPADGSRAEEGENVQFRKRGPKERPKPKKEAKESKAAKEAKESKADERCLGALRILWSGGDDISRLVFLILGCVFQV